MRISRSAFAIIIGLGTTATVAPLITAAYAASTYIDRAPSGQLMGAEYWDQTVYGPKDEKVGEVKDFVVDPNTGAISALVLGVGGFLGMGEKEVAVPFADVKMTMRGNKSWLTIDITKDALKAAPAFVRTTANAKPMSDTAAKPLADPAKPVPATKPVPDTMAKPLGDPAKPMPDTMQKPAATDAMAPVPGANSFTEAQARSRIESQGYAAVGALSKDAEGVWRGMAIKDGKQVSVAVDFKGNVMMQ